MDRENHVSVVVKLELFTNVRVYPQKSFPKWTRTLTGLQGKLNDVNLISRNSSMSLGSLRSCNRYPPNPCPKKRKLKSQPNDTLKNDRYRRIASSWRTGSTIVTSRKRRCWTLTTGPASSPTTGSPAAAAVRAASSTTDSACSSSTYSTSRRPSFTGSCSRFSARPLSFKTQRERETERGSRFRFLLLLSLSLSLSLPLSFCLHLSTSPHLLFSVSITKKTTIWHLYWWSRNGVFFYSKKRVWPLVEMDGSNDHRHPRAISGLIIYNKTTLFVSVFPS